MNTSHYHSNFRKLAVFNDRWGFGWFIENNENDIRPVNSVYWSGAVNSYYTLDIQNKIAVVYFSNYFPENDKESYDFYKLYEKITYTEIKSKYRFANNKLNGRFWPRLCENSKTASCSTF